MELPESKKTFDAKIADTVKNQMNVTKADGKTMQGLVNRRSREKDVFDGVNPVFPELSEDADLNTAQKYAALNLLLEVESSGGTKTGLETIGNTVGKYHIKQDKAALVDPSIKKMSSSQFKKYIKNNPDKEEELVSGYLDVEINKMLDRTGVDRSQLNPNEYAAVVSNLYNKGNQPTLLKNTAKLTQFRQKAFPKTNKKTQNINQDEPIRDVGQDIPMEEEKFPLDRVQDIPEEKSMYEKIKPYVPVLRYFNEGGAVPMKKQMEMFEYGGLKDEGGTVDPVSGNDVPPGSTQEEVRDDIPAQLSEGEFVFPADVVRFIGLNTLMQMRQQAKMGLKQMEEMGQMGNSEEATMPDDLPFDINDLDMEDELEYNVGGFVPGTVEQQQYGISGMQQAAAPTTGVAAVPQKAASSQYVRPIQAEVPTTPVYRPKEIPTFKGFVGENVPGVDFEYVEYKNEAGNVIKLRKSKTTGDLLDPVPEGYTFVDPEATKVEEATVAPTTPQTTSVREEQTGGEDRDSYGPTDEEIYGPGGGRFGIGSGNEQEKFGISFDNAGLFPGMSAAFSVASNEPLPSNASVTFQNEDGKFTLTGDEYNNLKQVERESGSRNSDATKATFKELQFKATNREAAAKAKKIAEEAKAARSKEEIARQRRIANEALAKQAAEDVATDDLFTKFTEDYEFGSGYTQSNETTGDQTPQDGGFDSSGQGSFASDESDRGRATGGLISKPKPKKTKKMKRGGLASKK